MAKGQAQNLDRTRLFRLDLSACAIDLPCFFACIVSTMGREGEVKLYFMKGCVSTNHRTPGSVQPKVLSQFPHQPGAVFTSLPCNYVQRKHIHCSIAASFNSAVCQVAGASTRSTPASTSFPFSSAWTLAHYFGLGD